MACLQILEYPDSRLRLKSRPVKLFDEDLARLIDDLCETLRDSKGIGLAAPQTGDLRQVLVIDLTGGQQAPEIYVNPEILSKGSPALVEESCLSVPEVVGNLVRAIQVRVRARDRWGAIFERDLDGMSAVCLQHEMDHLVGKLFIDHLSFFQRLRIRLAATSKQGFTLTESPRREDGKI